jgi:uncharacterized protein
MSVNQASEQDQRPSIWRWVLGTLLIILVWQIAGTVLTIVAAVATGMTLEEFLPDGGFTIGELAPDRAALVLMAIMVSFIPFFLANLFAYRFILNRRASALLSSGQFSFRRVLSGFSVWIVLGLVGTFVAAVLNPGAVTWTFNPTGLLPFVVVALLLIPIQTTAEELFFRGWLLQWTDNGRRNAYVLALINGVIFALPHLANPEVAGEDLIRAVSYVAVGSAWAWVTLRDRSLELAIGAHAANNISGVLLVGYDGSAIPSISLWNMGRIPVEHEILINVAGALAFTLLMRVKSQPGSTQVY